MFYCEQCMLRSATSECPNCGKVELRNVRPTDFVFLIEQDAIWSGVVEDLLKSNGVLFSKRGKLGAGITAKIGYANEAYWFFVPHDVYDRAKELLSVVIPNSALL